MSQVHVLRRGSRRYILGDVATLPYLALETFESMTYGGVDFANGWEAAGIVFTYAGQVASEDFETSTLSNNTPPGPDFGWDGTGIVYGLGFTLQPVSQFSVAGASASFTVAVSQGFTPYTYQWYKSAIALSNGGVVAGATTATLSLTGLTAGYFGTGIYTCVVTDAQGVSVTSNAASLTDLVDDWSARVVTNGGAAPSGGTVSALKTFVAGLMSDGIYSKMVSFNPIAPDNLTAAITPVLIGGGNDPWTNHNFVSGNLTVNGLLGDGSSKYLDTGLQPATVFPSDNVGGLTTYIVTNSTPNSVVMGVDHTSSPNRFAMEMFANVTYLDIFNFTAGQGRISATNTGWTGYMSGNRTSASDMAIYEANSGVAHNTLVSTSSSSATGTRPPRNFFVFCLNTSGGPGFYLGERLSFVAVHQGLTSSESNNFYNRIQTLRTSFGGGFI